MHCPVPIRRPCSICCARRSPATSRPRPSLGCKARSTGSATRSTTAASGSRSASSAARIGRSDLALGDDDIATAKRLHPRWRPDTWGADEAARIAILLAAYHADDAAFAGRIDRLCTTAELTEHVAYLKGFAVFPAARELHDRAREGVRSSTRLIFEAIATDNPYPFEYFDTAAWNQMVVKCVFVECPIERIVGLDERRNPELVQMLRDFISERRAAGRPLPDAVHRYAGDH